MFHDYLTVVSVCGHNDGRSALPAILESTRQLPGSNGLLLSVQKPANLPGGIRWKRVLPMDYPQYSLFMMFCLQHFIESDYCLVVQDDGWVVNGKNWQPEFLSFDYLGAPCHAAFVGGRLERGYRWVKSPGAVVIQNGGFSLRSRKYLRAPSHHGVLYRFSGQETDLYNEDVQLTGIYRGELEALGVKFAPNSIAKQFAVEFLGPFFHDDVELTRLLGIHGQIRKLTAPMQVEYLVTDAQVGTIHREREMVSLLKTLGYRISFSVGG